MAPALASGPASSGDSTSGGGTEGGLVSELSPASPDGAEPASVATLAVEVSGTQLARNQSRSAGFRKSMPAMSLQSRSSGGGDSGEGTGSAGRAGSGSTGGAASTSPSASLGTGCAEASRTFDLGA